MTIELFDKRALLFLPASNPRAIMHARESDADLVILDLEDAVKPEDKDSAREAAVAALKEDWRTAVPIRVNGAHPQWHGPDVVAVMHDKPDAVVVPRVESKDELGFVRNQTGLPVLAMIETAKGVLAADTIGHEAAALIAGTNDLAADLRLPREAGGK